MQNEPQPHMLNSYWMQSAMSLPYRTLHRDRPDSSPLPSNKADAPKSSLPHAGSDPGLRMSIRQETNSGNPGGRWV